MSTLYLSNSTPEHLPKRNGNIYPQKPYPRIFIAALYITAQNGKKPDVHQQENG